MRKMMIIFKRVKKVKWEEEMTVKMMGILKVRKEEIRTRQIKRAE
jgi:hypothetical protein